MLYASINAPRYCDIDAIEITELRHCDTSERERRRVFALGYPVQCAAGIVGREGGQPSESIEIPSHLLLSLSYIRS